MKKEKQETFQVKVTMEKKELGYIVSGAFEGGSNYWIDSVRARTLKGKPYRKNGYMSDVIERGDGKLTITLIEPIDFDGERKSHGEQLDYELTQAKLIKGIGMYLSEESHESISNWDAGAYDCILQYALFGRGVFG